MSELNDQIKLMESTIESAKPAIETAEALARLMDNPDFKHVFMDGFLRDFAVSQVRMKSRPEMQHEDAQKGINASLDGVGALWGYIDAVNAAGNHAANQTEQCLQAIYELENTPADELEG
ncbi:hypothetical protein VPHK479_0016 [Vibrio phage K479]